ncbi:MAG: tRNA (guanosine(46)-N7)-methyltransferase TrmB [Bacteroidales bacterium]|nr:tRNA (guanosine(46)-N7)-methyltransferase TrmB [Bacteroidales bacterium]
MTKKKLQRFAEMETFSNVVQPEFEEVFGKDYALKGKWNQERFGNHHPVVLELGCGKGEYTVGLARRFPEKSFIGVDIKGSRMWRGARTALSEKLPNVLFLRTHIEQITSFFGPGEVEEIWITFPDPQLKKKRKRLTSARFLNNYKHFLVNNGLVHLKTDSTGLYEYTLELARNNNLVIRHQTNDLYHSGMCNDILDIKTFYEQQFLNQGMKINYLCFELPHEKTIEETVDK